MDYERLHELIDHFQAYEEATGQPDLAGFADWLHLQTRGKEPTGSGFLPEGHPHFDGQLGFAIGLLYQHAKHYFKTAMHGTDLVSMFDFGFLASLAQMGDARKSDLIQRNVIEFSPGMEVIRRLLRKALIEEFPDPEDGRSKRVQLTAKGQKAYREISDRVLLISTIIGGNLSAEEKRLAIPILFKLVKFHEPIWRESHGQSLEKILEKYLKDSQDAPN